MYTPYAGWALSLTTPTLLSCPSSSWPAALSLSSPGLQAEGRMWHLVKDGEIKLQNTCGPACACTGLGGALRQGTAKPPPTLPPTHPQISSDRRPGHLQRGPRPRLHLPILSQSKGTGPQGQGAVSGPPSSEQASFSPSNGSHLRPHLQEVTWLRNQVVIPVIRQSELPWSPLKPSWQIF